MLKIIFIIAKNSKIPKVPTSELQAYFVMKLEGGEMNLWQEKMA